ncbi:MAG: 2-dehydropantoate 2-reductase [Candidatus Protistobacter heckmanni]|nr:2-dehydropantoate 2-reductase [Candidatus Protistobacter heckmanni]
MKICIFGAGAIGGLIAARLATQAAVGAEVSVVARGAHLRAIREHGLRLRLRAADGGLHGETSAARIRATDDAAELGVQDYVIVAVKTGSLAAALPGLRPLLGPDTVVVPAMNGVPWWFFQGFGGPLDGMRLEGVDPQGAIAAALPLERVLSCVVYPTSYIAEPGRIQHTGRWDLHLGEPAAAPGAAPSARLLKLQALLAQAGFQCKVSADIRSEIWLKLIGNASFNPVSALSCATLDRMLDDPELYALLESLMEEVIGTGRALGLKLEETPRQRLEKGRPLGAVKFSMLQDVEAGRTLEYEALTGAVLAVGRALNMRLPMLAAVHGLIRQRDRRLAEAQKKTPEAAFAR